MSNSRRVRVPSISAINRITLVLTILIFLAILYGTTLIDRDYRATIKAMNNYMEWETAGRAIQFGTDYLTDQAKFYATTLNKRYADNYFQELYEVKNRERAMEALTRHNLHSDDEEDCQLQQAVDLSNALSQREIYAIRLIAGAAEQNLDRYPESVRGVILTPEDDALAADAKIARARSMLFDLSYQEAKNEIHDLLGIFLRNNANNFRREQQRQSEALGDALQTERVLLIILLALNIAVFALIILLIGRPLRIFLRCVKEDKKLTETGAYEFRQFAGAYNEIFAVKELHDKMLKHKAEHDPLTGLLNRSAFDSLKELMKGPGYDIGLLLIDVDKFKQINDEYGHIRGDETLRAVADQLNRNFRADDYCIRVGGDEFAVVFQSGDAEMVGIIKEKITSINDALLHPTDDIPPVSLSVGGAISKTGFAEDLYQQADEALYKVKEAGRRGCRFYNEQEQAEQK